MKPTILGVIPARMNSTRLPGKPLKDICGAPMIEHVWRRVMASKVFSRVIVATDEFCIYDTVIKFGGEAKLTTPLHPNGTSRVAEVSEEIESDYVMNIQGDEPLLNPLMLKELAEGIEKHRDAHMMSLCAQITNDSDFNNPNVVKVIMNKHSEALYFSRSPIPYVRDDNYIPFWKHIGVYLFTRKFLHAYTLLAPTPLMRAESLEQLQVLEHGYAITMIPTKQQILGPSVDTPEDLEKVRYLMSRGIGEY